MLPRSSRALGRVLATGVLSVGLGVGLGVGLAGPAAAHVTVNPEEALQGDWQKLAFSVPNEEEKADTVKVEVRIPTDPAFPTVRVKPHPGWKVDVTETELDQTQKVGEYELDEAVSKVTWTAEAGTGIAPGEFDEFEISVGPLPEQAEVLFPAIQTYDNGSVVKWDQPMGANGEEPEHPAPALLLTEPAAGAAGHHHSEAEPAAGGDDGDSEQATVEQTTPAASTSTVDTTARTLGGLGLAVGVLCLVVLVFNTVAGRERGSSK